MLLREWGSMEKIAGRVVSLQVGKPKTWDWEGQEWRTAIFKAPITERVSLEKRNLQGDKQANTKHHGGPDKAVCCFASEHFAYWKEKLDLANGFDYGAFGENFTLEGLTENNVCIGDIFAVGEARVQVSQPRQPCINLARKWNYTPMPEEMIAIGHTGFYLRVLQPGSVGAGDRISLLERLHPGLTIARLNAAMFQKEGGIEMAAFLAELPELFWGWRQVFFRRLPTAMKARITTKDTLEEA